MGNGAVFSADRKYRYVLWRTWSDAPPCNFIMLNPSTADEVKNDPTVERCERRARAMGFGGLVVTNIFAFRSTDPEALRFVDDPVGPDNDHEILEQARRSGMAIVAWGTHGSYRSRGMEVRRLLGSLDLYCLGVTSQGYPRHPLYVPYSQKPILFRGGVA